MNERQKTLEALEERKKRLAMELHDLREQTRKIKQPANWKRYAKKKWPNRIKGGATCQELFGKRRKDLTAEELKEYNRIKMNEWRNRNKAI